MPDHEEHCLHSEKRYGVRGDDVHRWIDEPSQVAGGSHRNYRHDLDSLSTAIQMFGEYGAEMVENIFLDHLLLDSREDRKNKEIKKGEFPNPKIWTKEEDSYLIRKVLFETDAEMEAVLQNKTKHAIAKRRRYLGLIRPKIIKRTRKSQRVQRIVFRLKRGKKFYTQIKVNGGKNDIDFWTTDSKNRTTRYSYLARERIINEKSLVFTPQITGRYSFYFSNAFSIFTSKDVVISYHLENKPVLRLRMTI